MTLGKQISRLRAAKGLSQEDLANDLQVSRQSISKWETDTSVPELDKLLKLSEVFGVTLDELVKGPAEEAAQAIPTETPTSSPAPVPAVSGTQKIIGIILLCFGVLLSLLMLFLINDGWLIGCILGLPFLLCGILCLTAKRRAGLWCGWVWFSAVMLYLYLATGIQWTLIFRTIGYDPQWNYVRLAAAWGMFFAILLMLVCTLRSFRHLTIIPSRRAVCLLVLGWLTWLAVSYLLDAVLFRPWGAILSQPPYPASMGFEIAISVRNLLRFAALNALLAGSLALRRGWKAARCH